MLARVDQSHPYTGRGVGCLPSDQKPQPLDHTQLPTLQIVRHFCVLVVSEFKHTEVTFSTGGLQDNLNHIFLICEYVSGHFHFLLFLWLGSLVTHADVSQRLNKPVFFSVCLLFGCLPVLIIYTGRAEVTCNCDVANLHARCLYPPFPQVGCWLNHYWDSCKYIHSVMSPVPRGNSTH